MYDILNFKQFAKSLNNLTFTQIYYDLKLLALAVFKWDGLPNNMDERWIEKYLFDRGECMFYHDDALGYMVAGDNRNGINHYNDPVSLMPVAPSYFNPKKYTPGVDAVLIKNNDLSIPTNLKTQLYAYRLADIKRTQDININAQKTPVLIVCSDKQKLTLKNVYAQWSGNEPVIFGDKAVDFNEIQVMKTDAPIVFDKLQTQYHQVKNEYLTLIGINNANMDKKERLVDDEVQANNEEVKAFFNAMLKAREQACKEINRIFGLNISVSRRIEFTEVSEGSEDAPNGSEGSEKEVA